MEVQAWASARDDDDHLADGGDEEKHAGSNPCRNIDDPQLVAPGQV
jgi:hypothetical protein